MSLRQQYAWATVTCAYRKCHAPEGEFNFKEHVNHVWLKADELSRLDWAAADFKALPYIKDE